MKRMSFLKKCLMIVFHPADCMVIVKRERDSLPLWQPTLLYLLAITVNYAYIFMVHFLFAEKETTDANLGLECAMVIVPLLTWTVAAYAMTAILSGESKFKEQFTAYAYALVPYIVLTPVLGLLSNLCGSSQAGLYQFLRVVVLLWVLALIFFALMQLNDYSFMKTVGVALLSLLMMAVIWAVILLVASMTVQFATFFTDVFKEFSYKM